MIVPMKKVTLLLSTKHRDSALLHLRQLGILHVHDVKPKTDDDIESLEADIEKVDRVLKMLEPEPQMEQAPSDQPMTIVEQTLSLHQQQDSVNRELSEYRITAEWFERWGDISYASVQALKNAGVFVHLYITDKNGLARIPDDKQVLVVGNTRNVVHLALFSQSADQRLEYREEVIPQIEPGDVRAKISELSTRGKQIADQLNSIAVYRDALTDYRLKLGKSLEINRVKSGMGDLGDISYIQGFCPNEVATSVPQVADKHGWGYMIDDPDQPSHVPTLIRNSKFVSMISPLFSFMSTLPGYDEQDVSFIFLAFFSIFFAIIVGDGGYGLVFLLLTVVMSMKIKNANRDIINLMFLLSGTTLIWGLITGTWFGSQTIAGLPFLRPFVIHKLDSFGEESESFIMWLSFVIGVVHLSIAHLMVAAKKRNMTSLAEFGWVSVLWAIFFLANNLVLGRELPGCSMMMLWTGIAVILLFGNFQRNIFKGMLATLITLPLSVIGSFSDVVSYVRLFAVGFAGFIVASSFNSMAVGAGIDSVVSGIVAALIMFISHALNLTLCCMSVLVHGVRLNMLEFSGHVGVQWTGKPYAPFKE